MGETFVARISNDFLYVIPPEAFVSTYTQTTETSTYHRPDVPETKTSGVDTVLFIGTLTLLASAVMIAVILNNPQILRRLEANSSDDNRGSLDGQDSLQ